jgi:hypothetical protein
MHARISPFSQQLLDRSDKLGVDVPRKRVTGVIGKDPDQHDCIVLHISLRLGWIGKIFAYSQSSLSSGIGTRFGSLDDGWEVEVVIPL